jgi:hypothetical protein
MEAVRDALLSAPAQPPATGPQRVVAWLGVQSHPGEGQTQTPTSASAATGPVTGAGSPFTTPRSPATDPAGSSDEESYADPFAPDSVEIRAAGGDEYEPVHGQEEPDARQDDEPPRRTLPVRKAALAAVAATLLITVLALVQGGRDADASSSSIAADTMSSVIDSLPAAPAVPDPTLLAEIWSRLALAEQQDFEDQFVAAFHTLQSADSSVVTVLAQFPGSAEVQILADSVQSQIQGTLGRCTSLRDVNLKRNVTGPDCPVVEPPPPETDSISTTVSL